MPPILPTPQRQQRPPIRNMLQPLQQRHQMHQIIIRRIVDPSLYRYRVVYFQLAHFSHFQNHQAERTGKGKENIP